VIPERDGQHNGGGQTEVDKHTSSQQGLAEKVPSSEGGAWISVGVRRPSSPVPASLDILGIVSYPLATGVGPIRKGDNKRR
jgi:hypothetical protein